VFAKAIHYASPRAAMPLLELNCAALPDTLLESELFGFEPGAFTDARRRKVGLLERALSGTLFLDEVATMSASVQAKLLRVLEESTFMRLGGTHPIKINLRLIAATNADLKDAVARGTFRERSLLPSEGRSPIHSPLRERREDIVPLALDLLQQFNRELKKRFTGLTPGAAELLQNYLWPGNIRELKNVIERTMILAAEGDVDAAALPEEIRDYARGGSKNGSGDTAASDLDVSPTGRQLVSLRELEDDYIQEVLAATGNDKTHAARILGIHPTSLLRRLKKEQAE